MVNTQRSRADEDRVNMLLEVRKLRKMVKDEERNGGIGKENY